MFIGTDSCLEQIKRSFAWYYKQSKRGKSAELLRRKLGLLIIVFAVMSIKFIRLNSELNNQRSKFSEMKKNYHLQFDRISGRVEERYDSFPSKGYWKFEGFCEKTNRKF